MADQLSAVDLDVLERQITEPHAHALTMMDGQTILALIQRLREAEAEIRATRGVAEQEKLTAKHLEKMAFQWQSVALENRARIAQLERVRAAAQRLREAEKRYDDGSLKDRVPNGILINEARAELVAALAAPEEP